MSDTPAFRSGRPVGRRRLSRSACSEHADGGGGAIGRVGSGELTNEEESVEDGNGGDGFGSAVCGCPVDEVAGPGNPAVDELRDDGPVRLTSRGSESAGLEVPRRLASRPNVNWLRPSSLAAASAASRRSSRLWGYPSAPHRYLDVGAGEVAHRSVGCGPDVLFVHGWPLSGATFRRLLPHLVDHVTCHLIDLPGAGSSRFTARTPLTIAHHITSVRTVVDLLELDDVAVVGHDSGGMIARHAMADDPRLRALGLIDTERPVGSSWKFRSFVAARRIPGGATALGWLAGTPRLRRSRLVLGDAFVDRTLLDGEFDEFFLQPLHRSRTHRDAAMRVFRSFDHQLVRDLADLHPRITVPVQLVWGEHDRFFPVARARQMTEEFPDARVEVVAGVGLMSHEERPLDVARALLPVLTSFNRSDGPDHPS